ncbi:hypothetical protein ACLB2K_000674 [Fragaria x ananassa]
MESKSKSEPERYIICGQTKFEGKWVPIFYESVFDCGLVAIANILSLHGELPGGPHKIGFYSVEQLMTLVATKLSAVKRITIDDAKGRLTPLAGHIEADVNYRRIEVVNFPGHDIFSDLRIPLFHAWKVVPEVHVDPQTFEVGMLEVAAQDSSITPQETDFIRNTYSETEGTTYGYTALAAVLQHVRSGICVFYWNSLFYTVRKEDDRLFLVNNSGEWAKFYMRKNSLLGPSLGRRKFMVICGGMTDASFRTVVRGDHFDMIIINYDNFNGSRVAKEKVFNWLGRLRHAGFLGVVIAILWCDGSEFEQWVNDDIYSQVGINGIRYVRGDCLEESEDFIRELVPIFDEAVWRREVVYPVEFPANIKSYEYIWRG